MALTVAQVVGLPELGLTVRTESAPLDRQVRWVAVSELVDPTPWLEGGDLLLTTGMSIVDETEQTAAYVARLVEADVAALGFGIGLTHQTIPATLIASGERAGLPIVEVPQPVPFVAVSKAVSGLLSAQEYAESAASFESQRRLIRAALKEPAGGTDELVAVLARHVGGFCLHLDRRGGVLAARPRSAAARAAEFTDEIDRLQPRGLLGSSAVASADEHVVVLPIGVGGTADAFLVVGGTRALRPADQAVVNVAVSLMSWHASRRSTPDARMDPWHRLLLATAVEHGLDADLLEELGLAALRPRRAAAAVWRGLAGRPIPGNVLAAIGAVPGVLACSRPAGDVMGVVAVDDAGHLPPELLATSAAEGVAALGISGPLDLTHASNLRQALDQAEAAAAMGPGLQVFDHQPARGLTSLIDAATTTTWARGYLGDLLTTGEGPELMSTVRAWLDQHGQVDAAAQQLGIHRHTVRHRIRRAEVVLGRSLDDPGVRADLWFALTAVRED